MSDLPSVDEILSATADERRRDDARAAIELITRTTGAEARVWGPSIVGFGHAPYTTADAKVHDWFAVGLSPRKAALTFYGLLQDGPDELLDLLGPHTTGKGCLYVKRLDAIDTAVLGEIVARAWREKHVPH
ncbi:DUF1801 domain-containing protein [Nocardioides okcheonensis]|uniref:DUF1801 domain-containing protein n=1 Tax=Nocardioides okcheonensis TaxID=2894081 RepID=UPI001E3521CA|nr:DUF1801 domain-containing protein [Nocardioides okcheonensis]UFN42918.1 DUF1801 domain-containing protein [Nocardioides okcheonensis]